MGSTCNLIKLNWEILKESHSSYKPATLCQITWDQPLSKPPHVTVTKQEDFIIVHKLAGIVTGGANTESDNGKSSLSVWVCAPTDHP
jgi:hypothetical protein